MMKRYIISAVLMLFTAIGFAQKDVTAQYITNATLSNGTTGWTITNLQNAPKQGNNTTGWAMEFYAGWNNLDKRNFSTFQTITLPAGNYTLVNYSFFRQGEKYNSNQNKSLAYLKAGNNQVVIKTLGSINNAGGYADSQEEGANVFDSKMYRNAVDFTITQDNTSIEIGVYGTFDERRSWCILGMFELINRDLLATSDAPFNVTGYIKNAGFEYRNLEEWTQSENNYFEAQGDDNAPFKKGGYYAQKKQDNGALPAGSMSQTISGLPAGYYVLSANVGGDGAYIDVNGHTTPCSSDGYYSAYCQLSANENLTITAGKTADGTANWIHFEDFQLHYYSELPPLPPFEAALYAARDAQANDQTGATTSAFNQWAEYDRFSDNPTNFSSEAEMNQAIAILNNAMTIAQNNGSATSLINNANFSGGIQTATVTGSGGKVEYPTGWTFGYTYDGWNDTFVNQDEGLFNAWAGSITWAELSQVISNLPNGQYRLTAEVMTDEGNDIKYRGASAVAIYGAPLGGNVGRSPEVTTSDFSPYEVEFQVNQNQATIGIRSDLHYYKIRNIQLTYVPTNNATAQRDMLQQDYFWLRNESDVDMTSDKYAEAKGATLYPQYANQIIRVNSDDVIEHYGENDYANIVVNGYCEFLFLEDLQPLEITNGSFDVFFAGYERTMNYIYGTVILPWPVYEEDVKVYEAHLYEMTGFTEGTDEVNRNKLNFTHIEGTVPANTPILFRMMDGVPEEESFVITSYYVTVQNTVSESKNTQAPGWSHQGYYAEQNFNTTDTYYIAHNHFWQVSTTVKVPPFRTVFRNSNSGANVYGISVDDELADAIKRIEIQESTSGKRGIYNISGQKVSDNTNTDGIAPGLYIINGKKVLVK